MLYRVVWDYKRAFHKHSCWSELYWWSHLEFSVLTSVLTGLDGTVSGSSFPSQKPTYWSIRDSEVTSEATLYLCSISTSKTSSSLHFLETRVLTLGFQGVRTSVSQLSDPVFPLHDIKRYLDSIFWTVELSSATPMNRYKH